MKTKLQLKEELKLTEGLSNVVEVMKQVAVNSLRSLEKLQVRFDEFSRALQEFFYWIDVKEVRHPFFKSEAKAHLVVFITSDVGFLGGQNTAVIQEGLARFERGRGDGVAVIGERGKHLLQDIGYSPEAAFPGISDAIGREETGAVKEWIVAKIVEERFGSASVFYTHYESVTRQRVERLDLFPCKALPQSKVGAGFPRPLKAPSGAVPSGAVTAPLLDEQFVMESPLEEIIAYLVELWTSERLYTLFWHSKLSEFAGRMLRLEESHQELREQKKRLTYAYFRRVHEETDRSIREIVAARSQMEKAYSV